MIYRWTLGEEKQGVRAMNDPQSIQSIENLWNDYLNTLPGTHRDRLCPLPEAWSFGNDKRLADELVNLVVIGTKTATCSRYLVFHWDLPVQH